jgi:hypothetical protein
VIYSSKKKLRLEHISKTEQGAVLDMVRSFCFGGAIFCVPIASSKFLLCFGLPDFFSDCSVLLAFFGITRPFSCKQE